MNDHNCKSANPTEIRSYNTSDLNAKRASHFAADPSAILIRMPEVMAIVGLARPTIYKLMQQADSGFPLPVKLSASNARSAPVAWVLAEVLDWTRARIADRDKVAA
ncbi:AlpA family phage regulatory protein [Pseudomonas poae]|uniref:helix-turn-helix transcriptional regulator n=1 Tax=Pseudomonas TaxID=286 RepID=UPI0009BF2357|nr:AlpA family phage regulatory protein [Pseudomonas fluorescens]MBD8098101.1 AlpA family phage regulatory protein [Pseudomonas fluorescens]MBD8775880.1 AlpA family phage regulatory protein [Pseudomonas fluorescens]MBD8779121.1 AlpA family phage regulatory protein [Pseudomonas fluorescens]MBD8795651.1 AlpA family phage regulatory protein [Pseudomonas fluorescens]